MKIKYEFMDGTVSEVKDPIDLVSIEGRGMEQPFPNACHKLLFFRKKKILVRAPPSDSSFQK